MFSNIMKKPILSMSSDNYDLLLLILAPLLTSVNGIAIDLYAPSLPYIAHAFHVAPGVAKFSISVGLIGFAIGALLFGVLSDHWGRRQPILFGLALFTAASLLAVESHSIMTFMLARLLQGAGVAIAAMLIRAALLDRFTGKKLYAAMAYTTLAWGLGPVVAPFIGGYLQEIFNWQANFIAYFFYGALNLILVYLFFNETLTGQLRIKSKATARILHVITDKQFIVFALFSGLCFSEFVLYNLVAPFIVEGTMGYSAVTFGHTALFVGLGYLSGNLLNRFFIKYLNVRTILYIGTGLVFAAINLLVLFALFHYHTLWALVAPIVVMTIGVGALFANAIGKCLAHFSQHSGTAACIHGTSVMLIGFIITAVVSPIKIHSVFTIASIIAIYWVGQIILLFIARRKGFI